MDYYIPTIVVLWYEVLDTVARNWEALLLAVWLDGSLGHVPRRFASFVIEHTFFATVRHNYIPHS